MPTTCAFNSDPIATPAANKVTLTGGRPDGQPGGQEGVTAPRVLPARLLGAAASPVTPEPFYCQRSTRSSAAHGCAACCLDGRQAAISAGTPGTPSRVPAEVVALSLLCVARGHDMEFPPGLHAWAGGSVPLALLHSPAASQAGPSAPGLAQEAPHHGLGGRGKQGRVLFPSRTQPGLL